MEKDLKHLKTLILIKKYIIIITIFIINLPFTIESLLYPT